MYITFVTFCKPWKVAWYSDLKLPLLKECTSKLQKVLYLNGKEEIIEYIYKGECKKSILGQPRWSEPLAFYSYHRFEFFYRTYT